MRRLPGPSREAAKAGLTARASRHKRTYNRGQMSQRTDAGPARGVTPPPMSDAAWNLVLAAAAEAERAEQRNRAASFVARAGGRLELVPDDNDGPEGTVGHQGPDTDDGDD